MSSAKRKAEDSAEGCRAFERDDRERAAANASEHMRAVLERSANAWSARARLLDRLERAFNDQAATYSAETRHRRAEVKPHG